MSVSPTPSRGNVYDCAGCARRYRFRAHRLGHLVYVQEKKYPWSHESAWRQLPQPWPSTLTKFRCRCGSGLVVR